jgi:cytochrome c-type biogenesis protein CcmH/NrfG
MSKVKRRSIFFLIYCLSNFSFFVPVFSGVDPEASLKEALDKANRGDNEEAIKELEQVKRSMPGDARVALSLGLLYQSTDRHDQAIQELEQANNLSPSFQASYALGLLYESKWVKTDDSSWKNKAVQAWENCLKLSPADGPHRDTVNRHLQRLRNSE